MCIRHFLPTDYIKNGDKFVLNTSATPSVFSDQNEFVEIISNEFVDGFIGESEPKKCVQCPFLLQKIKDLEHEILVMKTEHNVLTAKTEQKNKELKAKNAQKSKQLSVSQKEASRLKEILDQLKTENYITDTEQDFLNVMSFCNFATLDEHLILFCRLLTCVK